MGPGPVIVKPMYTANTPPSSIWPVPPMLNSPARKVTATASPASSSGVVAMRVSLQPFSEKKAPSMSAQ